MSSPDAGDMAGAVEAVLVPSNELPEDATVVTGPIVKGKDLGEVLDSYHTTGYQATHFGIAIAEVEAMLKWRLCDDQILLNTARANGSVTDEEAKHIKAKVFLGLTSSLLLGGVRESVKYLAKNSLIQVIVTPGGGIDGDVVRSLAPDLVTIGTYNSTTSNSKQGNIEIHPSAKDIVIKHVTTILEKCYSESNTWTPSAFVAALGKTLNESSVLYWCSKNSIPVYCPSIIDGWVGDAIHAFNENLIDNNKSPLKIDLIADVKNMNCEATKAKYTGMVILGGGIVKHHICNANLMRNGANHSIFLGTGQEFDGSDAGARPDEAVSWGKIRPGTRPVKVYGDASFLFPLLVAKAFVPYQQQQLKKN
eukprot:TRINITY_DN12880_c0_g1_i4.p1 TRINITY_DN12880_c0_g1~~TRINITY_DN12880_c0_g1_i4.p1  ORF type:complete len:364 (+),score=64.47 TRINITY_DN12880_c0_g1_i4:80-1171(+)